MIDLTPLEVRQKKGDFRRAFRGYDPELVSDFLDLVADRMEELVRENLSLREALESVEEEITTYRQKEQALSDALMTAQKLREDARANVEKETELLVREARIKAEAVRDDVARQMVHEEETLRRLRARRAQLVESFRRLLDRELSELDIIEETLELGESPEPRAPAATPPEPEAPTATAPEPEAPEPEALVGDTDLWDAPPERAQQQEEELPTDEPTEKPKATEAGAGGADDDDAPLEEWLSTLIEEEE